MKNTALIELLSTFSKAELKKFDLFADSKYFNNRAAVTKLWVELKHFAPEFSSPKLKREYVYQRIFPGKEFNYGTLKNLMYELTLLIKKFIELEHYSKESIQGQFNFLEAAINRRLTGTLKKSFKAAQKSIEENFHEEAYYRNKYRLHSLEQNYHIQQDKYYDTALSSELGNNSITSGFFIDAFHNNYNQLLIKTELSAGSENGFMKKVLQFYDSAPVKFDFRVRIFYHAIMLIYDGSSTHFYEMKKLVDENLSRLSRGEKYNFLVALSGYCYIKYEEGSEEFLKYEFDICRYMIESGLYNYDGAAAVDGPFYRNAALSALKLNETEWALRFIEEYRYYLNPKIREHYYLHALIEYNFKTRNFDQALKHLSKIKHSLVIDKIQIKKWELMVNYEKREFNALSYFIDSAKHFIYNDDKINRLKKDRLNGFIQVVDKLAQLGFKRQTEKDLSEELHLFKKEVSGMKYSSKFWLNEKITEIEERK